MQWLGWEDLKVHLVPLPATVPTLPGCSKPCPALGTRRDGAAAALGVQLAGCCLPAEEKQAASSSKALAENPFEIENFWSAVLPGIQAPGAGSSCTGADSSADFQRAQRGLSWDTQVGNAGEEHQVLLHGTDPQGKCKWRILGGRVRLLAEDLAPGCCWQLLWNCSQFHTQLQLGTGGGDALRWWWAPSELHRNQTLGNQARENV